MSTEVTPAAEGFLQRALVAVLATIDGKGRPRTAPVWFLWDGSAPVLFTGRSTLKWRNIEANPQVSLCIDDRSGTYEAVIIDGRVEEATDRSLFDDVLAMALAYYGEDRGRTFAENYRRERPDIALFRIVPERIVHQRS